jgi:hypothetical protein
MRPNGKHEFSGCQKFSPELSVVIRKILADPPKDARSSAGSLSPLVEIQIPSKQTMGYTILGQGMRPKIPKEALAHLNREGSSALCLPLSQSTSPDSGPDLGDRAIAKVIRFDPYNCNYDSPNGLDLYVTVVDGCGPERPVGSPASPRKLIMVTQLASSLSRPPKHFHHLRRSRFVDSTVERSAPLRGSW